MRIQNDSRGDDVSPRWSQIRTIRRMFHKFEASTVDLLQCSSTCVTWSIVLKKPMRQASCFTDFAADLSNQLTVVFSGHCLHTFLSSKTSLSNLARFSSLSEVFGRPSLSSSTTSWRRRLNSVNPKNYRRLWRTLVSVSTKQIRFNFWTWVTKQRTRTNRTSIFHFIQVIMLQRHPLSAPSRVKMTF